MATTIKDPSLSLGGQFATTGETKEEYDRRLQNAATYAKMTLDAGGDRILDKDFLGKLPYSMQVNTKNDFQGVLVDQYSVFLENLKESFGEDLLSNAAVEETLANLSPQVLEQSLDLSLIGTTEVGGSDALNSYWSFNENDDIVYPTYAADPRTCKIGFGRVYAETYQRNQVILWMTFGVPKYAGIWDFYNDAINPELAKAMHSGTSPTASILGRIAGSVLIFSFNVATLPLYVLNQIGKVFNTYKITKYYELNITMPLYFRAVNNILGSIATNMGLQQAGGVSKDGVKTESVKDYDINNLPSMLKEGLDIYRIMAKRSTYITDAKNNSQNKKSSDELYEIMSRHDKDDNPIESIEAEAPGFGNMFGWFLDKASDAFTAHATGSTHYIGFRIEKSVDASESFSNSTGQSQLQSNLNSMVSAANEAKFTTMEGTLGQSGVTGFISDVGKALGNFVSGFADAIKVEGLFGAITGAGYFDIPEIYKDSSFSSSYSFSTKLVSHYADRVSIFQNCYIPLACLLAAALPRQVGKNSYIQPFLLRAYCRGRFAVSLGIIDSISVRRGSDEFGWTSEGLPTQIDVSWTIKDLSPIIFMGLGGGLGDGILPNLSEILESNNNFQEYLSTLSGLGLQERVIAIEQIKRKFKTWLYTSWTTRLLNPYFWGSTIGNIPALQTIMAWNWSRLSNR